MPVDLYQPRRRTRALHPDTLAIMTAVVTVGGMLIAIVIGLAAIRPRDDLSGGSARTAQVDIP